MSCTSCDRKWHSACVGLEGLTQSITNKIVSWKCPLCFRFSKVIKGKLDKGDLEESEGGSDNVACGVKEEVTKQIGDCIPEIVEKVMGGVRAALSDPEAFKDASQKITQSWADIAKKEQKTMISDVVEKTSETALKKSISLIDANLTEQRKRVRNSGVFFKTPHPKSKRPYITLAKGFISNASQKALYSMHENKTLITKIKLLPTIFKNSCVTLSM